MANLDAGWYKDPGEPTTQRYWDGEGWLGAPLPLGVTPPAGPPPRLAAPPDPQEVALPPVPVQPYGPLPDLAARAFLPPPRIHGFRLAQPGVRLVARLIDICVLLLLNVVVNGWFVWQWWRETFPVMKTVYDALNAGQPVPPQEQNPRVGWLQTAILAVAAALWLAYEVPAIANTGQTLGKRIMGIRVVALETAEPIGFLRSLRRWNLMGLPMLLWSCFGLGLLIQFVDSVAILFNQPFWQALHDRQAQTVVVAARSNDQPLIGPDPTGPAQPGGSP